MSLGKKILSAFVEIEDDKAEDAPPATAKTSAPAGNTATVTTEGSQKFKAYFEKLFRESNMPGPDYFEFTKMVEAMSAIPDEKTRYATAYAGLSIQGLDKQKLIATAQQYIGILDKDAQNFDNSVSAALQEKVVAKKQEMADKAKRIQDLTNEINELNARLQTLNGEIRENEEKIASNSGAYRQESEAMKGRIGADISKINQYIS